MSENQKQAIKRAHIKVWVSDQEKEEIRQKAEQHDLSYSSYLRKLGLGYKPESNLDAKAVSELAKLNADQGRLGGLLKMWLSNDERLEQFNKSKVELLIKSLLAQIYDSQKILLDKVKAL